MIKSFRHAGIKRFFETGSKAGIQPKHAKRLRLQLSRLDAATVPADMDLPGWRFHSLKGQLTGILPCGWTRTGESLSDSRAETPFWWITRTITDEGRYGTDA
jgi:hypothetical protein